MWFWRDGVRGVPCDRRHQGCLQRVYNERAMHSTVEDTPLLHTERPDDYLYVSFGDGVWFGADQMDMTKFLKGHLDILERPFPPPWQGNGCSNRCGNRARN